MKGKMGKMGSKSSYQSGGDLASRKMASATKDMEMGGGRMAKQAKQRVAVGTKGTSTAGKIPPRPGKIDS